MKAICFRLYLLIMIIPLFPLYVLARVLRLIKVKGWSLRKFFPGENGLITYSNHIKTVETVVIPLLLAPFFIIWTNLLIVSVAKKKWYGKRWFAPFRPAALMVSPGEGIGVEESTKEIIYFLKKSKKILHIYPTGFRLKNIKKAKKETKRLENREIGRFYAGMLVMLLATKRDILPMWITYGRWPLMTVIINKERIPFASLDLPDKPFSQFTKEEIREGLIKLEDMLLKTK